MTARPTTRFHQLEGSMTLDGLTLRARLIGDELTIALDDPAAAVDTLDLVDEQSQEIVLSRDGLAVRTRTRAIVKQMSDQLHDAGRTAALHAISRMRPDGDIDSEAVAALSRAVSLAGRGEMWGWIMTRVRESFGRLHPADPDALTPPFLAAAFADLVGTHGFDAEHYEAMTSSWRVAIGPLPADGPEREDQLVRRAS